jgi:DNA polymerase-4
MERRIIHLNIADFSVAVERLMDSSLQGRPLIIAPRVPRATVYDMSEEAYQDGVRKGMPLIRARRRCRRAIILPPQLEQYEKAIQCCIRHVLPFSPQVERAKGEGHLYLDVTGTHRLFGPPPDIGCRIRNTLCRDLGLNPIWSVGPNKLVAKVASRIVKPVGEYLVASGEERAFLAPLPLSLLPTVHRDEYIRLREVGLYFVSQAASLSLQDLSILCGHRADTLYNSLRGIDQTPVHTPATAENRFFFQRRLAEDSNQEEIIRPAVLALARQAGFSLRRQRLGCRQIKVSLVYSDGICCTRRVACKSIAFFDRDLEQPAITALFRCWRRRVRVRTICLACTGLCRWVQQLSLLDTVNKKTV